ncbi:MAG: TMAO reductase system periplasmic protein TorT [Burkholderiaceae bacterium]|nr:TMAO reductase system periplasmic protein TorT [Burkholderiaceae bacterium]
MKRFLIPVLLLTAPACAGESAWFPMAAQIDGKPGRYAPLPQAARPWRICALLPHARDKYWWGVSWGLSDEAARLGVRLGVYQAGGYEFQSAQRRQFADCVAQRADAVIVGAISAHGLNDDIDAAARHRIPVIDLINGVSSAAVTARSLLSFTDMASAASRYLLADAGGKPVKVLWLPGPKDATWVRDAELGMRRTFADAPVDVIHGGYGPTDASSQMSLLRAALAHHQPDYVLGNAVAVEVASKLFAYRTDRTDGKRSRIIAYYATEPVVNLIRDGRVLAAPSDAAVLQARVALDLAVRALESKAYARRVAPVIDMLTMETLAGYDLTRLLAPPGQRFIQQALPVR